MDKEFYTTGELAVLLGVQRLTLFRHVQRGQLVAYKVGKNYRFRRQDIEAWLERLKVQPRWAAVGEPDPGRAVPAGKKTKKGKVKHGETNE